MKKACKKYVREAKEKDLIRIAEIFIFNYRLNFYPIFKNDDFYFSELQSDKIAESFKQRIHINNIYVYDDGAVKGFIETDKNEIKKLFVEPILQGNSIGSVLLNFALENFQAKFLWALEQNTRAINFYKRHGFVLTNEKELEECTEEYLVKLIYKQ